MVSNWYLPSYVSEAVLIFISLLPQFPQLSVECDLLGLCFLIFFSSTCSHPYDNVWPGKTEWSQVNNVTWRTLNITPSFMDMSHKIITFHKTLLITSVDMRRFYLGSPWTPFSTKIGVMENDKGTEVPIYVKIHCKPLR